MSRTQAVRFSPISIAFALLLLAGVTHARVPYPVGAAYEDAARVVVIYNESMGSCEAFWVTPVGPLTRDSVITSLDTGYVHSRVRACGCVHFRWEETLSRFAHEEGDP